MALFLVKIMLQQKAVFKVWNPYRICLMGHITPQSIGKHDLGPLKPPPGVFPGPGGSKMGHFGVKIQLYCHGAIIGYGILTESVSWAISHPNP